MWTQALIEVLQCIQLYKIIALFLLYILIKQAIAYTQRIIELREVKALDAITFDDNAFDALDSLIKNVLDEYKIFNINTKNMPYITSKDEQAITKYMQEEVSKRISLTLIKKLELSINSDYIGEYIGTRIYLNVLDFVLEYNTSSPSDK